MPPHKICGLNFKKSFKLFPLKDIQFVSMWKCLQRLLMLKRILWTCPFVKVFSSLKVCPLQLQHSALSFMDSSIQPLYHQMLCALCAMSSRLAVRADNGGNYNITAVHKAGASLVKWSISNLIQIINLHMYWLCRRKTWSQFKMLRVRGGSCVHTQTK